MSSSDDLWRENCSFFEQPFAKQLEMNDKVMSEHLTRWKQTAQAKALCPEGFRLITDISITDYSDYPAMLRFKSEIESLERNSPRRPGEISWEYYERIGRIASRPIADFLIGDFAFAAKTTGTEGEPKWAAHGATVWENFKQDVITTMLFACSNRWGSTSFKIGDKGLNFTPSTPMLSGWGRKASHHLEVSTPPVEVMDEIPDARRRFFAALEHLQKGEKVNLAGGIAPSVYLMCEYFSNPESLFEEYYHSMGIGLPKLYVLQKWAESRFSRRSRNVKDYLDLKGLMIGGVDTALYADYIRTKLGVEPLCIYGVTEFGLPMFGCPDRKGDLMPNLRSCFFEFREEDGQIRSISEIKQGGAYDLILTPFGATFMRYDIGDMVRVTDIRDDGMPFFSFWGRRKATITIGRVPPHITEALATQIMAAAGLSLSDKWAMSKVIDGREKILVLMENTWGLSEKQASKRIFEGMISINPDLMQYSLEYGITDPEDMVKVEYLRRGAFLRYTMELAKEGKPMGQIKPPKIIPADRLEICDTLRRT